MKFVRLLLPLLLVVPGIVKATVAALAPTESLEKIDQKCLAAMDSREHLHAQLLDAEEKWVAAGKPAYGIVHTLWETARAAFEVADKQCEEALEELRKKVGENDIAQRDLIL
jgi:hypothetical protein